MDPNATLVHRWLAIFNDRDFASCADLATEVYTEHAVAPFGREAPGAVNGPRHLAEAAQWLLAQFPDLEMRLEDLVSAGDRVAARVISEGTNLGPLNGVVPPTGRRFRSAQSHWFRVEDGRLAEHWATRDDLGAMIQLGVVQPPGPPRG